MRRNEGGENNPVYMQEDGKQEDAKGRGCEKISGLVREERGGPAWHHHPTTRLEVAPKP